MEINTEAEKHNKSKCIRIITECRKQKIKC
jgi:hypothetical protein